MKGRIAVPPAPGIEGVASFCGCMAVAGPGATGLILFWLSGGFEDVSISLEVLEGAVKGFFDVVLSDS